MVCPRDQWVSVEIVEGKFAASLSTLQNSSCGYQVEGNDQQRIAFVDHFAPAPIPAKPAKNAKADKDLAVAA